MTDLRSRAVRALRDLADRLEHRTITLEGFRRNPKPGKYWLYCDEVSLHSWDPAMRLRSGINVRPELLGAELERRRPIEEDAEGFVRFAGLANGFYQGAAWQQGELVYVFEPLKIGQQYPYYPAGPFPIEMTVTR